MARGSDTQLGTGSDTHCRRLVPGQRVSISVGVMEGLQGIIVERRQQQGRVLVLVQDGLYIEIQDYCLQVVD